MVPNDQLTWSTVVSGARLAPSAPCHAHVSTCQTWPTLYAGVSQPPGARRSRGDNAHLKLIVQD